MASEHDFTVENTNYTLSTVPYLMTDRTLYNYNRLRLTDNIKEENWFANIIADIDNYYGESYIDSNEYEFFRAISADTPFDLKPKQKTTERVKYLDVFIALTSATQMKRTASSSDCKR